MSFHPDKKPVTPRARSQPALEWFQSGKGSVVETLEKMRVILQAAEHKKDLWIFPTFVSHQGFQAGWRVIRFELGYQIVGKTLWVGVAFADQPLG